MIIADADLAQLLAHWMPQQRWYAAKGREAGFVVRHLADLSDSPAMAIYVVTASFTSPDATASPSVGDLTGLESALAQPTSIAHTYQVPLVFRTEPVARLEHALVGVLDGGEPAGGQLWIYDALQDRDVTGLWVAGIAAQLHTGALVFERFTEDELPVNELSLALTSEQSNTSLVFGDSAILKVFRRLEPGVNPDIEIHRALTALGAEHVAPLHGSVSAQLHSQTLSLAMLQKFMRTAADGWELAKTSVRDLMAEGDLHAAEAGGDFAAEAHRLGIATAAVHADLATAFGLEPARSDQLIAVSEAMHSRLDAALDAVPALYDVADGLRETFAAFAASAQSSELPPLQRVHGDLHLGQCLRTSHRWIILDFEGEPTKPLVARRAFDSPLRDLAGMMRSFDYAARYQLVDTSQASQLEYRAVEWAERNRSAYCAGYAEASGTDPAVYEAVLRGYEADKAVYEAVYEARNRPDWLVVPLTSLARLVAAK